MARQDASNAGRVFALTRIMTGTVEKNRIQPKIFERIVHQDPEFVGEKQSRCDKDIKIDNPGPTRRVALNIDPGTTRLRYEVEVQFFV